VHELSVPDFEAFPCWEYASDEEGREGQDESTVRPMTLAQLARATQQVLVSAAFFFPNGRTRLGMVTLNAGADPSGHQPALFLASGPLMFYVGATQPKSSAIKRFVGALRQISPTPLPVRYISALSRSNGKPYASGSLEGLYWLVNWRTGELRAEA
jgi:hypothetical protein